MPQYRDVQYVASQRVVDHWMSPWRDGHARNYEFLEIRLASPRLISEIHFDVWHWPQRVSVDYWDGSTWRPWTSRVKTGNSTVCNILDSVGIPGAGGRWERQRFQPVVRKVQRFRIAARRLVWEEKWWVNQHRHPRLANGRLATYPIGVRHLDIKYTATRREEIPRPKPPPPPAKPPAPPAIPGRRYSYSLFERPAQSILPDYLSRIGFADATSAKLRERGLQTRFWKSEPQPFTYAVVNFYADTRDDDGAAQTLNAFFIDPLYTGCAINLYYSNDDPTEAFEARHSAIPYGLALNSGTAAYDVTRKGLYYTIGTDSWTSVEGKAIDFNPSKSWWVGAKVYLTQASSEAGSKPLIDVHNNLVYMTQDKIKFRNDRGVSIEHDISFPAGSTIGVVAGYDAATSRLYIYYRRLDVEDAETEMVEGIAPDVSVDRLAAYVWINKTGLNVGPLNRGGFALQSMVLKSGVVMDNVEAEQFFADPVQYAEHAEIADRDVDASTDNSVLRFLPDGVTDGNPTGMYGGPGDYYENLVWTPVMRNYRAYKGYMNFHQTRAKYWKFEFTNLVAEPYSVIEPVRRRVRMFPLSLLQSYRTAITRRDDPPKASVYDPGTEALKNLADLLRHNDSLPRFRTLLELQNYTQTEAFHALDPEVQERLETISSAWRFLPWHQPGEAPVWSQVGRHNYAQVEVEHKGKVGFFCGLKSLVPVLVNYQANDDTDQYVEQFIDLSNVDSSTWTLEPGGVGFDMEDGYLSSGSSSNAVATSKVFPSARKVRGVQFATTQSNSTQLLRDHDFNDPLHLRWTPVGDAEFLPDAIHVDNLGKTLGVMRTGAQVTGGLDSEAVGVAAGGRLFIAARVSAAQPLSAPLWLQILDADTGNVLIEQSASVTGVEPVEWYVGTRLGGPTSVRARLVQKETTTDIWYTDDISLYEDPILWEFTADGTTWIPASDVRNNPHGVVTFPDDGSPETNRSLQWRVTAYRPDCTIGALVIRPWYHGLLSGIAPRVGQNHGGPSMSSYDHYPPIEDDPRFKVWHKPIPHDWWLSFRLLYLNATMGQPARLTVQMHEDLVAGVDSA